jgi:biotin carboxyl carrier protein
MRVALRYKSQHLTLDVHAEPTGHRVRIDGQEHRVAVRRLDDSTLFLMLDGRAYRAAIARNGRDRWVAVQGEVYTFSPETGAPSAHQIGSVASPEVTAPMPGKILHVLVAPGDRVSAGDALLILEAMKMETRLLAESTGTVRTVRVAAGDMVDGGQTLVVLDYVLTGP